MKNLIKVLGIIALVAVIGFSFAACNGKDDNGGGGGGGGGDGEGKLTITGLPNGGSFGVSVFAAGTDISTLSAIGNAMNPANGVWQATGTSSSNVFNLNVPLQIGQTWTGSGNRPVLLQDHNAIQNGGVSHRYTTVNFSNGSATVPFSSFTAVTN